MLAVSLLVGGAAASHVLQAVPLMASNGSEASSFSCSEPSAIQGGSFEGFVLSDVIDGRCATVIRPSDKSNLPIILCYHGQVASEEFDDSCARLKDDEGNTFGDLAMSKGFALVLMQMRGTFWGVGGTWMTVSTGTNCSNAASGDELGYATGILDMIKGSYSGLVTSHVYTMGFSSGSIPSTYAGVCLHTSTSYGVSAWATHSTGVFEDTLGSKPGGHGGTPSSPAYMPIYPSTKIGGLKGCFYDGTADTGMMFDLSMYNSTLLLYDLWTGAGNEGEKHIKQGAGHVDVVSLPAMLECLDNGEGNLPSRVTSHRL